MSNPIKEELAAIEHERWSDWQTWMHQCAYTDYDAEGKTIYCYTEEQISRWDKQITTPYSELTEKEKKSDMDQVDRYWPIIEAYIAERLEERELETAASLYDYGMKLGLSHGASTIVVGGTDLDKLLNHIERKYRKEVIWNKVDQLKSNERVSNE